MYKLLFIFNFLFFFIGFCGFVLNRRHFLLVLLGIEIMLLSIVFGFILFSNLFQDSMGYIFSLFILTIAASESAIGLALLIVYYSKRRNILISKNYSLKS